MSKALLWLSLLFMFTSMVSATSPPYYTIPATDAPEYCMNVAPTATTAAGTTPYTTFTGQYGITQLDYTTNGFSTSAIELGTLALTLSFATIAVAYALSRLFPHLGIRNWLQGEYWEVTKTVILFAVIFAIITLISNVTYAFLVPVPGSPAPTPVSVGDITPLLNGAETYLCNVNYQLTNTFAWIGLLGSGTGFWSNMKLGVYDFLPIPPAISLIGGSVFLPFNNWALQAGNPQIAPYGSIIGDSVNLLLFPFAVIASISIDILPSMAFVGLVFFIPLGLLFRAFPFIRGIGGTLVAIGFGMAVVFPAVLIIFNGVFMNYIGQAIAINPPPVPDITYQAFSSTSSTLTGAGSLANENTIGSACPFNIDGGAFGLAGLAFCDTALFPMDPFGFFDPAIIFTSSDEGNPNNPAANPAGYLNGANVFSDVAVYQYMDIILSIGTYIVVQLVLTTADLLIIYTITDSIARSLGGTVRFQLGGKLRIAS